MSHMPVQQQASSMLTLIMRSPGSVISVSKLLAIVAVVVVVVLLFMPVMSAALQTYCHKSC